MACRATEGDENRPVPLYGRLSACARLSIALCRFSTVRPILIGLVTVVDKATSGVTNAAQLEKLPYKKC